MNLAECIVKALYGAPVSPAVARRRPDDGGLVEAPGFYAWWLVPDALPGVPPQPHPRDGTDLDLLYVGIAPNSAKSQRTVRSRVLDNHLGGNIGSSTFRYSLAALLMDAESFQPTMKKTEKATKYQLSREDNRRLSDWQQMSLFLTWCEQPEPWKGKLEKRVIAAMQPPLNLAENQSHPFHEVLSKARGRLRDAARSASAA